MMHVIDAVLDSFSNLFRSHRYPPLEKLYSVFLFTAGLSLRDLLQVHIEGISKDMGSQVLIVIQTIKES
jgi:hypothetical protein